ncbi:MAG: glycosyltransferase N-terminal domain-containing protein [Bdellovibrionota bacterium]|nr:glycosyltransferase N-terminal domain-containing protein [Bdellovibrionota bacterium]
MAKFFSIIYRYFAVPLLSVLAILLSPFNKKLQDGLRARNWGMGRKYPKKIGSKKIYWFHCSSGEIEYALPLMRMLKKQMDCKILLSWHSPSVLKLIKSDSPIDYVVASPWESFSSYNKFIKHFQPDRLFVARTDLWPAMLESARRNEIPSMLFAATFVEGSGRNASFLSRKFYSWVHNLVDQIYCVTDEDKSLFLSLNYKGDIFVSGDTRYEQVIWKLEQSTQFPINIAHDSRLIMIAGSTWPEDEKQLLQAYLNSKNEYRLVIAPHEPSEDHLMPLIAFCENNKLSYKLFSQTHDFKEDVLIIDKVGVLASAYEKADLAFIGGAFKSSIHSVMEGLAAGLICLFGPLHKNNREAIEFQNYSLNSSKNLNIANSVKDQMDLENRLHQIYTEKDQLKIYRKNIKELIQNKAGTSRAISIAISNT